MLKFGSIDRISSTDGSASMVRIHVVRILAGQRYRTSSPVKADEHALDFRGALEYGEDVRRSHRRLGHMFVTIGLACADNFR